MCNKLFLNGLNTYSIQWCKKIQSLVTPLMVSLTADGYQG
jgi:hypothetical protein